MNSVLRFGIPTLDRLLDDRPAVGGAGETGGVHLPEGEGIGSGATTSLCILGPNGTGKSLLAMHLTSRYVADCAGGKPKPFVPLAFYVSTDLKREMAEGTWKRFYLDRPRQRVVPFASTGNPYLGPELSLALKSYDVAGDENNISAYLSTIAKPLNPEVAFLDLASSTAGDDWGFINRLLAVVESPQPLQPRHLMVIDAVEGLQTLVGERDAFGEIASRRARIAQIMRAASGRCHIVFVVEEPTPIERLPEEFVADVVIHLRHSVVRNYARRTIEIEKVRGQSHVRGQHPLVIRAGRGSTTGQDPNWDDPKVMCEVNPESNPEVNKDREKTQGYVHVFPSLHLLSRQIMEDKQKPRSSPPNRFAGFGIPYLDEMLAGNTRTERERNEDSDHFGLQCSTVTALIGDPMTQKTELGRAFLSQAFVSYAERLWDIAMELVHPDKGGTPALDALLRGQPLLKVPVGKWDETVSYVTTLIRDRAKKISDRRVREVLNNLNLQGIEEETDQCAIELAWVVLESFGSSGEAVLLTTQDIHAEGLSEEFGSWVFEKIQDRIGSAEDSFKDALKRHIQCHTICRRLEIHDQSAPILMHIVSEAIKKAQEAVFLPDLISSKTNERFDKSWGIRLVIDDFSTLCETYPEIREDALFLPYLLFHLGREGVTSLIIDTQPGRPEMAGPGPLATELRALVQNRLYTWRVPFYREDRIAITVIPPLCRDVPAVVRELRWAFSDGGRRKLPVVDPHFELYSGLAEGRPQPVPLQVRLYKENEAFAKYIEQENNLFRELFTPLATGSEKAEVIVGEAVTGYDNLRDSSYLQRDTQLDYTLVFQIDEFWALKHHEPVQFRSQWDYLNAVTVNAKGGRDEFVDPFGLFQNTDGSPGIGEKRRGFISSNRSVMT